jgi:hypothetical protein
MTGPASPASAPAPSLHLPEEPDEARRRWRQAVFDGTTLGAVIEAPDGLGPWLWRRWRVLAQAGMKEGDLVDLCLGYRREIWLWLVGDRTWEQCCSGLIGRVSRRLGS